MSTSHIYADLAERVEAMDWHPRTKRNFRMQYRLARTTLIPWMRAHDVFSPGVSVCEIGCAEGGVLTACMEEGASFGLGTDIAGALLEQISAPLAKSLGVDVTYNTHDVINDDTEQWRNRFDVVILRDVIEHLDDPTAALVNIAKIMKPGAVLLITFPPYHSAYGGHQQLIGTQRANLPWIHLLPKPLFVSLISNGDEQNLEEVMRLHRIRCTPQKIRSALQVAGLATIHERYFGLRPVFRFKYQRQIPQVEVTWASALPLVKNLAMEAAFLVRKPSDV